MPSGEPPAVETESGKESTGQTLAVFCGKDKEVELLGSRLDEQTGKFPGIFYEFRMAFAGV